MAYGLFIRRTNGQISLDEWRTYVRSDPELSWEGVAKVASPERRMVLSVAGDGMVTWLKHPEAVAVWFDFIGGRIVVNGADDAVIQKMVQIAKQLNASVFGEEGESYS